ncbi:alpha/beta fold hydrolase [Marivita geojedonensis]|uniref:Alpha/beta hydrolase n=1 Tax=Marivita geojedonensis TaxID=1123756 RepID=A0A1X4NL72_9RHOB|nr:alpha/beta hydrolase [Marivita geojedonensis]OSQ50895.1 alpha/beta hydrolase [Marivita geojedonensis]PRY77410.1 pimeloyl-ACP methyl ester carboxylesterase [Marivita geojedonensis]
MTPLVFVHGFMGGSQQWQTQRKALERQVCVHTVDLPGFGESAHLDAPNKIACFANWVLDTLQAQGIDRFHLLGHSMGGMIVQEMIALAPERVDRLVLYGTGATGILPGRFEPIDTSKRRAQEEGARATARRIAATWFLAREDAPAYEGCASLAERTRLQAIVAGLDAMQDWSGVTRLSGIKAKTLVIWGDHDRTYPWSQTEQLWRTIGDASLAVIPNCAHAAHLEKPELFNGIVEDFLAS